MFTILLGPEGAGVMPEDSNIYRLFTLVAMRRITICRCLWHTLRLRSSRQALFLPWCRLPACFTRYARHRRGGKPFDVYGVRCSSSITRSLYCPSSDCVGAVLRGGLYQKGMPDVLRILVIPVGTMLIMLPLGLCIFGPAVSFVMGLVADLIIWLGTNAGPLCASWSARRGIS